LSDSKQLLFHYNQAVKNGSTLDIILVKTPEGRTEVSVRKQGLSVLERRVLILADGKRSVTALQGMLGATVPALAERLQAMGLLVPAGSLQAGSFTNDPDFAPTVASGLSDLEPAMAAEADIDEASADDLASDFAEEQSSGWQDRHGKGADGEPTTQPGMLTHRAASAHGIAYGKAYLSGTIDTMLGNDGGWLQRKIAHASTEADLYYVLEQFINTISVYSSATSVNGIITRFEEEVSRR
jgi:hypothetical protein